jgi:hypothetical protein
VKSPQHGFQDVRALAGVADPGFRRFKHSAQITRSRCPFIATSKQKQDVSKQLVTIFNELANNSVLSIFWGTVKR